ncbi:hypothetical protein AVEN_250603-1 [Araneus ventricosus]|uniref:DUF19 domain-containing protein n=1 Tax=Araneus ventricosus TaxID=182803 RepID=A0A4Y2KDQ8_ARAVE|nr:hypothetical protein AVEN_250603-1 [Araneus ventricosus]
MESKLSIAVLCFLGLFVSVQGLSLEPENLVKYEKCWNYANCLSDEKVPQKLKECCNILRPEEFKAIYQSIKDNYRYRSKHFYGAIEEYCKMDDAEKPNAYAKTLSGAMAYQKSVCAYGSKNGACTRITDKLGCLLGLLDQVKQQVPIDLEANISVCSRMQMTETLFISQPDYHETAGNYPPEQYSVVLDELNQEIPAEDETYGSDLEAEVTQYSDQEPILTIMWRRI